MVAEWREIPGYEGRYMVSNHGEVRSVTRLEKLKDGRARYRAGRLMKTRPNRTGYEMVCLRKQDGPVGKLITVHKLVAMAFIGPPNGQIRHLDGNKRNNRADNLAWGTAKENALDRHAHGTTANGERQGKAVLTESRVVHIRKLYSKGMGLSEIGRAVGMNRSRVYEVVARKTWKHVP